MFLFRLRLTLNSDTILYSPTVSTCTWNDCSHTWNLFSAPDCARTSAQEASVLCPDIAPPFFYAMSDRVEMWANAFTSFR